MKARKDQELLKVRDNGNIVTCGVILIDKKKRILAGHPTGRGYGKESYDLLKGCSNIGEEDLDTAIREMYEESSIDISQYKEQITDLGIHKYLKGKDIHLFMLEANLDIDTNKLWCNTYYINRNGKEKPEMNGYKIIEKNERFYFTRSIQEVLKKIGI